MLSAVLHLVVTGRSRKIIVAQTDESPSCVNNGTYHGRLDKTVERRNVPMKYGR